MQARPGPARTGRRQPGRPTPCGTPRRATPPVVTGSSLGDRVELRVIDRGPGIPPADLERVFTPFQRLGDTDNTTGVGLGLALSRGLTEAMGGTLTPEETPGGGLTMVVSLPAAPAPDEHGAATEPGCGSERGPGRRGRLAGARAGPA